MCFFLWVGRKGLNSRLELGRYLLWREGLTLGSGLVQKGPDSEGKVGGETSEAGRNAIGLL